MGNYLTSFRVLTGQDSRLPSLNEAERRLGYKMMELRGKRLHSLAHSPVTYPAKVGARISMGGAGIFLGTSKQFVLDYYSGLTDGAEVLVTFSVDPKHIVKDAGDEITASEAKIASITPQ